MTGFDIKAYKTFKSCFDDIMSGDRDTSQVPKEKVDEYKELYESEQFQAGLGFIEFFENSYACSGICEEAMFFYTLPLSDGPPENTCLNHMKTAI